MSFLKQDRNVVSEKGSAILYDGESINIVFETKPEIVKRLLPPPLEPLAKPLVSTYIAHFPRTNFGVSYREGALFLMCKYHRGK